MAQPFDEDVSRALIAFPESEIQNQFAIAFDRDERVLISKVLIVIRLNPLLLFADEGPNFVALYVFDRNADDQPAQDLFALLTGLSQDLHQRVNVKIRDALRAPQAVPFDHKFECHHNSFLGQVGAFQRGRVRLGVGLFANRATKTAKTIAMRTKALTSHFAG
jgi:hypothetical protein